MSYGIVFTGRFKKDYKLALSRGRDISKLDAVISALANGQTLEERYRDHALSGLFSGTRIKLTCVRPGSSVRPRVALRYNEPLRAVRFPGGPSTD